jgi:hypothetical protein
MQTAIQFALTEHQALMDEQVQIALDAALAPEAIQHVLSTAVKQAISAAVSDEVRLAFGFSGPGRLAIRAAVTAFMDDHYGELE